LVLLVLVLLAPALIVGPTLVLLVIMGDLVSGRVTLVEFLELYLLDLVLFVLFAYGLYRQMLWLVDRPHPASLDALQSDNAEETEDREAEEQTRSRRRRRNTDSRE
jgi:hypothetical protein